PPSLIRNAPGKNKWKSEVASPDYDYRLVQDRLAQLRIARESGDLASMIFILRTSLNRNLGDMGNPRVRSCDQEAELKSRNIGGAIRSGARGTKRLIDNYIEEVTRQLNLICDTETDDFDATAKYEFFTNTQKTLGRTALLLSGGAVLGLVHIGVIKTLFETNILPRIISGASAGSIVAAILCTRTDEELPSLFDPKNIHLISSLGLSSSLIYRIKAIFVQRYYGDITIVPSIGLSDFAQLISNPNAAMMTAYTIAGEQVSFIKNHCQVEMAIDEIIYRLRVKRFKGVQLADQPQSAKGKGALKRKIGGFTAIEQEPSTTTLFSRGTLRMPS
ncbi:hypothetical protein HK405_010720, partial [Cladochytrium tenue]